MYMDRQLEKHLHIKVCDYLRVAHPYALFRTDLGGIKLTMGQATQVKRMNGGKRAWPDLFIAHPSGKYHGLFIELKATDIYKKDGVTLKKNPHVEEQQLMLEMLRNRGYKAEFAVGYDQAVKLIKRYLSR